MKKRFLPAAAATLAGCVAALPSLAQDADTLSVNLRQVEVVSNRATEKTPVAFTNVTKKGTYRRQRRPRYSLPAPVNSLGDNNI